MIQHAKLVHEVLQKLIVGCGLAEFLDFAMESPEHHLLSVELDSTHKRLSGIVAQPELELSDDLPNLIALLKTCGRLSEDSGYHFLAADFERLADEAGSLKSQRVPVKA